MPLPSLPRRTVGATAAVTATAATTATAACFPSMPRRLFSSRQQPSACSVRHYSNPQRSPVSSQSTCPRLSRLSAITATATAARPATAVSCHSFTRSYTASSSSASVLSSAAGRRPNCRPRVRSGWCLSPRRSFHSSGRTLAAKRDYYEVLGVARTAGKDDIKKAYFGLAKRYHPDTVQGDKQQAAEKFAEVSNAYEVLSDDNRRQRYDAMGAAAEEMGGSDMGGGAGMGGQAGYNPEDILRDFFGSMGGAGGRSPFGFDMGGGGGGMGAGRRAGMADTPIDGDDIEVVLPLTFMEAVRGANKTINVHAQAACNTCQGTGNQPNSQPTTCKHCQGKGVVRHQTHTALAEQEHEALLLLLSVSQLWCACFLTASLLCALYCCSNSTLLVCLIACDDCWLYVVCACVCVCVFMCVCVFGGVSKL